MSLKMLVSLQVMQDSLCLQRIYQNGNFAKPKNDMARIPVPPMNTRGHPQRRYLFSRFSPTKPQIGPTTGFLRFSPSPGHKTTAKTTGGFCLRGRLSSQKSPCPGRSLGAGPPWRSSRPSAAAPARFCWASRVGGRETTVTARFVTWKWVKTPWST